MTKLEGLTPNVGTLCSWTDEGIRQKGLGVTGRRESAADVASAGRGRGRKRWAIPVMALVGALAAAGAVTIGRPASKASAVSGNDVIHTIAGTGTKGNTGDGGQATSAQVDPLGLVLDAAGNLYITDTNNGVIRKVDANGVITRFAGNPTATALGDGGPALAAKLAGPHAMVFDASGNAYVVEKEGHRIRKIGTNGIISTIAGNGTIGNAGDGGPATLATLAFPRDIAVGPAGQLYIADGNNAKIRKIDPAGVISTFAGTGALPSPGTPADGVPATASPIGEPLAVLYARGNLYFTDAFTGTVRKIDLASNVITTVAGTGVKGSAASPAGDGAQANTVQLVEPFRLVMDSTGSLYVSDEDVHRIRKILPNGLITTVAGTGALGSSGDGGSAGAAGIANPAGLALRANGSLLFAQFGDGKVREIVNAVSAAGTTQYLAIATRKQAHQPVGCSDVNWAAQQGLISPTEVRFLREAGVPCPDATVSTEGVPSEQYVVMLALSAFGQLKCDDIQWNSAYGYLTYSALINLATPSSGCVVSPYAKMVALRVSNRLSCNDIIWNLQNGIITPEESGWLGAPPLGCPV